MEISVMFGRQKCSMIRTNLGKTFSGDDCGGCCGSRTPPVFETYASTLSCGGGGSGGDRNSSCDSSDDEEDHCCKSKGQVHQVG